MAKKIYQESQQFHDWLVIGLLSLATLGLLYGAASYFWETDVTILYSTACLLLAAGLGYIIWWLTSLRYKLTVTDKKIKAFPEVAAVLGKAGRSDSSTDPAPLSMLETVIVLKPREQWRKVPTWYSKWAPEFVKPVLRRITPDTISIKDLEREVRQLRQANEIVRKASAYFAQAELDRPFKP